MKKKFIIILFFILNFNLTQSLANDINDFEIGPVSLGQSLLDYTNKDQLENLLSNTQYPNDKYLRYEISKILDFENYDFVDVMVKKNDSNYIIEAISAGILYDQLSECLKIKADIQKVVEDILQPSDKQETKFPSNQDSTGKSIIYGIQYYTKPYPSEESIIINCYHMTKESNIGRVLRVSVNTHDFTDFIVNDSNK